MKRTMLWISVICALILTIWCCSAVAESSGTYRSIDWTLDDNGVLTLGNGGRQTMMYSSDNDTHWSADDVLSVKCNGTIVCSDSLYRFFYRHTNMVSADLSGFDTSNVTSMICVFQGCSSLTSLDVSGFNTSKVTNMHGMFEGCENLTSLDVSRWDTSNVTQMGAKYGESYSSDYYGMFCNCKNLVSLDLSGWDTSNVIYMGSMFDSCGSLTSLNVSGWDTSNVVDMSYMFDDCRSLISLDVNSFDTSNVARVYGMFRNCSSLTSLDVTNFDTSKMISMYSMFSGCSHLTSLDVSKFDTSNVTNMEGMFRGCSGLTVLDVSGFDTSKVIDMGFVRTETNSYAGFDGMFYGCSGLTSLDVSKWDTSNVKYMGGLFDGCKSLTSLDVSKWNTHNVMDMGCMFEGCVGLTSLNLSGLDTSNVINMGVMFDGCTGLTSVDVSGWDTSKVKYMDGMFHDCTHLVTLDLSGFDTSNVEYMGTWRRYWGTRPYEVGAGMFQNCSSLVFLDVSGFDTSRASYMGRMFEGCDRLKEIMLGDKYNTTYTMSLPTPPSSLDGVEYTRKWIREDRMYGPFASYELASNYNNDTMPGKWIWEPRVTEYTLRFSSADYPGTVGAMMQVTTVTNADYQLAANQYVLYGFVFDHWDDGNGHTYADQAIIPANTYNAGDVITLNLVMRRRDTSVQMQDGEFTFSIYGNEKAFFAGVPAGTSYSVFEENLAEGWVLIAQSNSTGVIQPLEESEASFLNKYQPDLATIQFTGRKLMDGQPAKADSFSFELWEGNTLLQTTSVIDGGFVQFDMLSYGRNDAGVHTYTIKELIGTDDAVLYDGHEEMITVEVTTELGDDNITRVHAEVTSSDGTYPDILFQNWTKPGELSLTKLVDSLLAGHEDDEFRFRITFKQENGLPLSEDLTYSIEP